VSDHRFTCHSIGEPLRTFMDGRPATDGTVLGSSPTAAYLALDDFVVAVTARTVPLMPNGAAVVESDGLGAFEAGSTVRASSGGLRAGRVEVSWEGAAPVGLAAPPNVGHGARAVALRGRHLLGAMGHDDDPVAAIAAACPELGAGDGLEAVKLLFDALAHGRREAAREAAGLLTGRGPGLTPDGDDLLAAAAAATRAFEGPAGTSRDIGPGFRTALLVGNLGERTGALSATLLRLAARGHVIHPVRRLLDLSVDRPTWMRALNRLGRIGHSTGTTYALGCALTAVALTGGYGSDQASQLQEEKT
jgi:hypothetical protein